MKLPQGHGTPKAFVQMLQMGLQRGSRLISQGSSSALKKKKKNGVATGDGELRNEGAAQTRVCRRFSATRGSGQILNV